MSRIWNGEQEKDTLAMENIMGQQQEWHGRIKVSDKSFRQTSTETRKKGIYLYFSILV